jgi:hypothetical protein
LPTFAELRNWLTRSTAICSQKEKRRHRVQDQHLTAFTPELSTPSGGASQTGSMMPLTLSHWMNEAPGLEWNHIGQVPGAIVEVNAKVIPTGSQFSAISESTTIQRLACMALIYQLPEDTVWKAWDCLKEIYDWRTEATQTQVQPPEVHRIAVTRTRQAEKTPFVWGPD